MYSAYLRLLNLWKKLLERKCRSLNPSFTINFSQRYLILTRHYCTQLCLLANETLTVLYVPETKKKMIKLDWHILIIYASIVKSQKL